MPRLSDSARLGDYKRYQNASHAELMQLTRELIAMPFGDLTKLHKDEAQKLGATSPGVVFIRAVIFTRLANNQTKGPPYVQTS